MAIAEEVLVRERTSISGPFCIYGVRYQGSGYCSIATSLPEVSVMDEDGNVVIRPDLQSVVTFLCRNR